MAEKIIDYLVDEPSDNDLLGITNYIEGMATFIKECETPLTISIQGDWGSGKTTFIKQIEKSKVLGGTVKWVEIKTWELSFIENKSIFPYIVMEQIIDKIEGKDEGGNEIFNILGKFLPYSIGAVTGIDAAKFLEDIKDNSASTLYKKVDEIRDKFEKAVNNAITDDIKKVIIFIDDLDRLEPIVALDLLEKLKNFFTCKNCVYLLAIDESVVKQGVLEKYKNTIDIEGDYKQDQFFEKIIQVPFNLPIASYDINKLIKNQKYTDIIETMLPSKNPRNIKRLLNLHRLYCQILGKEVTNDNSKEALLALLALQINNKKEYEKTIVALSEYNTDDPASLDNIPNELIKLIDANIDSYVNLSNQLMKSITTDPNTITNDTKTLFNILEEGRTTEYKQYTISNLDKSGREYDKSRFVRNNNNFNMMTVKTEDAKTCLLYYFDKTKETYNSTMNKELSQLNNLSLKAKILAWPGDKAYIKYTIETDYNDKALLKKLVDIHLLGENGTLCQDMATYAHLCQQKASN